jgi:hypothetical protein
MEIRKEVPYVTSILYYGSEAWALKKRIEKQLKATPMLFWRIILKVPWTDKITNKDILKKSMRKGRRSKNSERNNQDSSDTF